MDIDSVVQAVLSRRHALDVVRLVRIKPGPQWHIEPRCHDDSLIYLILEGSCVGKLDGEACTWARGELWWVAPGVEHQFDPGPGAELQMFVFRWHLGLKRWPFKWQRLQHGLQCLLQFESLLDVWQYPTQEHQEMRFRCALAQFLITIHDAVQQDQQQQRGLSLTQRQRCYEIAAQHIAHDVKPEDLARDCGLALSHFRRLFKQTFHCSPRAWLARERIRHAASLIRDAGLSVEAAAKACGYQSMPSFTRCFKQVMGVTPSTFS